MRVQPLRKTSRRSFLAIAAATCFTLLPTAFSGDSIIQHVQDQTYVSVGFDAMEAGPHDLTMTLQANGAATAIDYTWYYDPNGTILWTSNDNYSSAFEHHWTANGVTGNEMMSPAQLKVRLVAWG